MSQHVFYSAPYNLHRATPGSSGFDLRATHDVMVKPLSTAAIKTGVRLALPHGWEAQVRGRSGLAFKQGLFAFVGTIDSDYRGEIQVLLFNTRSEPVSLQRDDRVAQLVVVPRTPYTFDVPFSWITERVFEDEHVNTERGVGGFGSTGTR